MSNENVWSQMIEKLNKIDSGRMTARIHNWEQEDDCYQSDFDAGWDNMESLAPRWENSDWYGAHENPYIFVQWLKEKFGEEDFLDKFINEVDYYLEETDWSIEGDIEYSCEVNPEYEEREALAEWLESVLPGWVFGENHHNWFLQIDEELKHKWNLILKKIELNEQRDKEMCDEYDRMVELEEKRKQLEKMKAG